MMYLSADREYYKFLSRDNVIACCKVNNMHNVRSIEKNDQAYCYDAKSYNRLGKVCRRHCRRNMLS